MIVCGIDPSLRATAVCVSGYDSKNYEMHMTRSEPEGDGVVARILRFDKLAKESAGNVRKWRDGDAVDLTLIEGYSPGSIHRGQDLCEYGGMLRREVLTWTHKLYEVAPGTLKKFVLKKGNGDKSLMLKAVYKRWGQDFDDDNEADAYALWRLAQMVANPKLCETQIDRECVETVLHGAAKKKRKQKSPSP